jgi:hypothetical protein
MLVGDIGKIGRARLAICDQLRQALRQEGREGGLERLPPIAGAGRAERLEKVDLRQHRDRDILALAPIG